MKHARKTIFLLLAAIFLVSTMVGCGSSQKTSSTTSLISSEQDPIPISRIGEETLQYPGENKNYKYNVYETYVAIDEYIGSEIDVTVPEAIDDLPVKVVGGFCFNKTIKNITLPEGIVVIETSAFDYCEVLESINIPENVTEIGSRAFYGCTSLKNLTIPKSVTTIGSKAFGIGDGEHGGFSPIDALIVKFYKGTAAAQYIADSAFDINFEIIG